MTAIMATGFTTSDRVSLTALLRGGQERAMRSGEFGPIAVVGGAGGAQSEMLVCQAKASAAPAEYRVFVEGGRVWVALMTADRYLSQSIEQDLVHTGDKLADLLHDELIDVEHPNAAPIAVEHFRDPAKLFTFRSAVPAADLAGTDDQRAEKVWLLLRAYQACFSNLGDMTAGDEE